MCFGPIAPICRRFVRLATARGECKANPGRGMPKEAEGRKQKAERRKWIEVASVEQGDEKQGVPENRKVKMQNGEGRVAQSVPIWEELPPHPGSFVKSVKTQGLEYTELGRIYGRLEAVNPKRPLPLRCTGKSAETIDEKGVGDAPLRRRVRKCKKGNGLDEDTTLRRLWRTGRRAIVSWAHSGDGVAQTKPQYITR